MPLSRYEQSMSSEVRIRLVQETVSILVGCIELLSTAALQ